MLPISADFALGVGVGMWVIRLLYQWFDVHSYEREAYEEGYRTGRDEGQQEGHWDGYRRGQREMRQDIKNRLGDCLQRW